MYYLYLIVSSKTGVLYIGYTNDIKKRIVKHNTNKNFSTKNKGPWVLAYCEMYKSKKDAQTREYRLKHYGQALNELKKRIDESLSLAHLVRG